MIGAVRIGTGYRPSFDIRNPAFREWVKLSVPLMLGVSLVTADDWILRHYAASGVGDITRLTFAKRLFAVPIAVLGQATGQASLPFFARLFNEKKLKEFADTVNDSVYRVSAASLLATGWMMVAALPLIDLVYRRGKFLFTDTETSAVYFFWFSLSLVLWSAQGLYARAFYRGRRHVDPDDRGQRDHVAVPADLWILVSHVRSHRAGLGIRYRDRHQLAGIGWASGSSRVSAAERITLEGIRESCRWFLLSPARSASK